jgi:hypothetical protein
MTDKYWLIYINDDSRESCNVFYSDLVICETKDEALKIAKKYYGKHCGVIELTPHKFLSVINN